MGYNVAPTNLTATTLDPYPLKNPQVPSTIPTAQTTPQREQYHKFTPPPPLSARDGKDFVCQYCCTIRKGVEGLDAAKWSWVFSRENSQITANPAKDSMCKETLTPTSVCLNLATPRRNCSVRAKPGLSIWKCNMLWDGIAFLETTIRQFSFRKRHLKPICRMNTLESFAPRF